MFEKHWARLLHKGWSVAKVERALAANAEGAARPKLRSEALVCFRQLVADIVKQVGTVHLYARFVSGVPQYEPTHTVATAIISLADFERSGFSEDTVTTVLQDADPRLPYADSAAGPRSRGR